MWRRLDDGWHLLTFFLWGETNGKEKEVLVNTSTLAWTYTRTEGKERVKNLPLTSGWTASMKMMKQNLCKWRNIRQNISKEKDIRIRIGRRIAQFLTLNERNENKFLIKHLPSLLKLSHLKMTNFTQTVTWFPNLHLNVIGAAGCTTT